MHGRLFSDLIQVSKRETLTTLGSRRGGGGGGEGEDLYSSVPYRGSLERRKDPDNEAWSWP